MIAAIFGKQNFDNLTFTVNGSQFAYGSFLNALLSFVLIATVIFFLVIKPVNALMDRLGVTAKRGAGARVPRVPEQGPRRGQPVRLLHVAAHARPAPRPST